MKKILLSTAVIFAAANFCGNAIAGNAIAASTIQAAEGDGGTGDNGQGQQPVFETDFSGSNPLDGWTVLDANFDGNTWKIVDGLAGVTYDSDAEGTTKAADEWLMSPKIAVADGQDYLLACTFRQQGAFDPDKVEVYVADANDAEPLYEKVSDESISANDGSSTCTVRISAKQTNSMLFILRLTTPNAGNGQLSVTHFSLTPEEKATPMPVDDFKAASSFNDKSVTLTWKNPTADTKGTALNGLISVNLYKDGTLIASLEEQEPGKEGSYTYSPEDFGGKATFAATAVVGGNESEKREQTINLDDLQGELVLVKSLAGVNRDNASEWAIEDNGGTSKWQYDYSNVFTFVYNLGQTDDDDWLISPSVSLETGKRYVLKYELKTSETYSTSVDVTIGKGQSSAAQTTVVSSHPSLLQNGFGLFESPQFTVEESADYSIGFHVTQANRTTSMRNLSVYRVDPKTSSVRLGLNTARMGYDRATATLTLPEGTAQLTVCDMGGRTVLHSKGANGKASLAQLGGGIYIAKAVTAEGKTLTLKVAK